MFSLRALGAGTRRTLPRERQLPDEARHHFNATTEGAIIIDGEYQSVPDVGTAGGAWSAPTSANRPDVRPMYNLIGGLLVERNGAFFTDMDRVVSSFAAAAFNFLTNPGGSSELMWWMCRPAPDDTACVIALNSVFTQPQVGILLEWLPTSGGQFRLRWSNGTAEEVASALSPDDTQLRGQHFYRLSRRSTTYRLYRDESLLLTCEQPNLNDLAQSFPFGFGSNGSAGNAIDGYIPQFIVDNRRASENMIATVRAEMEQWRDVTAMARFRFDFDKGASVSGAMAGVEDYGYRDYSADYLYNDPGDAPRATTIEETGRQIAQFNGAERMIYSGSISLMNFLHHTGGNFEIRARVYVDTSVDNVIFCNTDAVGSTGIGIDIDIRSGGQLRFRARNSGGTLNISSGVGAVVANNTWTTITIRKYGATVSVQVGTLVAVSGTLPTATSGDADDYLHIGARPNGTGAMTGCIAFITIHDYNLGDPLEPAEEAGWMGLMMGAIVGTPVAVPAWTNLVSSDLSTWTPTQCVVTGGQSDPDGGTDAWRLVDTAVASVHRIFTSPDVAIDAAQPATFRFFARPGTWNTLLCTMNGGASVNSIDLTTGAITGAALDSSSATPVGGGWHLYELVFPASRVTGAANSIQLYMGISYTGAGDSLFLYDVVVHQD